MDGVLRADTEIIISVGPFVSVVDASTPVTDVSLGAADCARLIKHGSSSSVDISGATWGAKTNCDGYYNLTLTTSWLDTEGLLEIIFRDNDIFMQLRFSYMVENAPSWDSKYAVAGTDYLPVDVNQWLGQAVTADSNVPEVHVVGIDNGTITANALGADCITSAKIADDAISSEHLATGAITADALGADCITNAKIADSAIGAENLAADCITNAKIADDAIAAENLATDSITSDALAASACTKIIDDFETQSQADPTGFHVNVLEVNGTAQTANDNGADINAILVDTNELQGLISDGAITALLSSFGASTDFNSTMKASINTEVLDVIATDTISEMSQGTPPGSPTPIQVLNYLYRALINKMTQTSTTRCIYDSAGSTILFQAPVSDDGTTLTKSKYVTGA